MDWTDLGKMLLVFGGVIVLMGLGLLLLGRIPFLGRLPGDLTLRRGNWSCYVPIVSSILLSLLLTLVLNVLLRLFRR
jgi:hypothetical protein